MLTLPLARETGPQAEHCDGADLPHMEFADESWRSDAGDTSECSACFIYEGLNSSRGAAVEQSRSSPGQKDFNLYFIIIILFRRVFKPHLTSLSYLKVKTAAKN